MSASIIQKKAAFATVTGSGEVAVTLDNPIGADTVIVIASALVQSDGSGTFSPSIGVVDDLGNGYSPDSYASGGTGFFANTYQGASIPQAGARTYTLSFTAPAGQSAYKFLAGICVYELSGTSYIGNGDGSQSLSGFHRISDLSASVSGLSGGTYGNFLVGIFASIFSSTLTDANAVGAGSGWTLDARDAIDGTFSPMAIVFESQLAGPASNPSATFSGSANNTVIDATILIGAYSLTSAIPGGGGGGGGDTSSVPFLGSVTEITDAPAGSPDIFVGTVVVVDSAPTGSTNPYLGKLLAVSPAPAGRSNPTLGKVVIVANAPAGDRDIFLGKFVKG